MRSTIVKAPAKVNLYLDVINKRPDGYHNIETVFERIDLCDWLKISILPKNIIKITSNESLPLGRNNTVYRAADLLIKKYNLKCGFKIEIDKRIPVAAGLGGGSSDGAAALLGICDLLNISVKREILAKMSAKIGADVPFFVSGYSRAHGTGIGEKLLPIKQAQTMYFLLVVPAIRIYTASVYNSIKLTLTKKLPNANILRHYSQYISITNLKHILYNKLEDVVLPSYPVLSTIKKALNKAGAEGILVSGSGSCVYGIFSGRKEAVRAEGVLSKKGNWQLFLTRNY